VADHGISNYNKIYVAIATIILVVVTGVFLIMPQ